MGNIQKITFIIALIMLSGCLTKPDFALSKVESRPTKPISVKPKPIKQKPVVAAIAEPRVNTVTDSKPKPIVHPAIARLLKQALEQQRKGDLSKSSALVERAVRIQPQDPLAWNRLAFIRLQQSNWVQAEQLALKSNSFSEGQSSLQLRNWRIITEARKRQGK